jgi:hypothetical protein
LCRKSAHVETDDSPLTRQGFDRENINSEGGAAGTVLASKLPGHLRKVPLLARRDSIFG